MVICFFGDSLVGGVNDPEGLGWVGRLLVQARKKDCALTGYNLGVRKNSSAMVMQRWQAETAARILPGEECGLVFAMGTVDMVLGEKGPNVPMEQSLANLWSILDKARAGHPCLVVGPPAMADKALTQRLGDLVRGYERVCAEMGVPFLNVLPELESSELYQGDLAAGDGVHPGAAGYTHIFRLVEAWDAWRDFIKGQES